MHTSTYCCESAFSTMNMVKNKYRSTLTHEHLHQCLCLAFTHFMPKFKPQKSVTFHTNKVIPHLLCIVRTFLLELCFWILTVTVPDPGLNGNLASGPFGFLIEYPCSRALHFSHIRLHAQIILEHPTSHTHTHTHAHTGCFIPGVLN